MSGSWPPPSAGSLVGASAPPRADAVAPNAPPQAGTLVGQPAPPRPESIVLPEQPQSVPTEQPLIPFAKDPSIFETVPPVVAPDPVESAHVAAIRRAQEVVRRENRRNRWAVLLIIVATALFATGVMASWTNARLLSSAGYVRTVQAAASDPAVVSAVSTQLVTQVGQPLLDRSAELTGTTKGPSGAVFDQAAFEQAVLASIAGAVASPTFVETWDAGQLKTQAEALTLVNGAVPTQQQLDGTTITIDLTPLQPVISNQLVQAGYGFAAQATPTPQPLVIQTSSSVAPFTGLLSTIRSIWWLLPLLGLLSATGAYLLSTRRLRLTLLFGVDLVLAMGAVKLVSRLLENVAGDRGLGPQDPPLLRATYQPFGQVLSHSALIGIVVGGVIAVVAIVLLSIRASRERRVRSRELREARAALTTTEQPVAPMPTR